MDPDLFIIIILLVAGSLLAFLSSILSYLSVDELNRVVGLHTHRAEILHKLNSRYDEKVNGYFVIEMFIYIIAAVLIGGRVISAANSWIETFLYVFLFFSIAISMRSLFFAIGIKFADTLAYKMVPLLEIAYIISLPVLKMSTFLNKTLGGEAHEDAQIEEISALVESAKEEGALDEDEYRILKNTMLFGEVMACDVMTPRTVLFAVPVGKTVAEVSHMPEMRLYSRFPVYEGESLDDGVAGYVLTRDVLLSVVEDRRDLTMRQLKRDVNFIHENVELDKALEQFLQSRQHLMVVVDDYGGVEGILTMEDVLETILGVEIVDEQDRVIDLRILAKQKRDKRVADRLL